MAGFIFSVGGDNTELELEDIIRKGVFAPYVSNQKNIVAGVLADFCSMRPGDNIYFFSKRKIYGVGCLICVGSDCKYKNYLSADKLEKVVTLKSEDGALIYDDPRARWFCLFEPSERFFRNGVDMDDALRYRSNKFKMLRAFEKKSFIKVDDEENQALKEFIYLKNRKSREAFSYTKEYHVKLDELLSTDYLIDTKMAVLSNESRKGEVSSEMVLEAALLDKMQKEGLFNKYYDYLSHQVIASPFKPLLWADRMDIFGYSYLKEFPGDSKPIEEYVVLELKKGDGDSETILQLMRYVDWICGEYASGDYSRIKAYTVAHDYPDVIGVSKIMSECNRSYLADTHPNRSDVWSDVTLLKYHIGKNGNIYLERFTI